MHIHTWLTFEAIQDGRNSQMTLGQTKKDQDLGSCIDIYLKSDGGSSWE